MTLLLPVPMQQTSLPHPPDLLLPTMTSSLIISSPPPPPRSQHHAAAPARHRPRLTINTQQTRTFGKGSSLRLETLSAVSPTARNTFQNAYETNRIQIVPALSPAPSDHLPDSPATPDPTDARTPSSSSISSASTFSDPGVIPYKVSHTVSSILVNSPIPTSERRKMSASQSRPIFPVEKRVSFRSPLEEEIRTTKYVWKHSDIESQGPESTSLLITDSAPSEASICETSDGTFSASDTVDEPSSTPPELSSQSSSSSFNESTLSALSSPPPSAVRLSFRPGRSKLKFHSPRVGDKRDSSSESESDSDSCPETPVAGRRKRRREWVWTLGPIAAQSPHPPIDESEPSDSTSATGSTSEYSTPASSRASWESTASSRVSDDSVEA